MNIKECNIGEKQFYTVGLDYDGDGDRLQLELLTGDFEGAVDDLVNSLEYLRFPSEQSIMTASLIWQAIKDNWNESQAFTVGGLGVEIEAVEPEASFSHEGCDLCNNGLGNDVLPVIFYQEAEDINTGEYIDGEVCGDCLCDYHAR